MSSIYSRIKYSEEVIKGPAPDGREDKIKMKGYVISGGNYYENEQIYMKSNVENDPGVSKNFDNMYKSSISAHIILNIHQDGILKVLLTYGIDEVINTFMPDERGSLYDFLLYEVSRLQTMEGGAELYNAYERYMGETIDDTIAYRQLYPDMRIINTRLNNYLKKFVEEYVNAKNDPDLWEIFEAKYHYSTILN